MTGSPGKREQGRATQADLSVPVGQDAHVQHLHPRRSTDSEEWGAHGTDPAAATRRQLSRSQSTMSTRPHRNYRHGG